MTPTAPHAPGARRERKQRQAEKGSATKAKRVEPQLETRAGSARTDQAEGAVSIWKSAPKSSIERAISVIEMDSRPDQEEPAPITYTFYFFKKAEGLFPPATDMPSFEVITCHHDDEARSRALGLLWDHGGCHGVEVWQDERQVLRFISDSLQGD